MGYPGRGKLFLLAVLAAALCGLVITIVPLILLVEGGVPTLPLRPAGAALLLLPRVLVGLSALDVLPLKPPRTRLSASDHL